MQRTHGDPSPEKPRVWEPPRLTRLEIGSTANEPGTGDDGGAAMFNAFALS